MCNAVVVSDLLTCILSPSAVVCRRAFQDHPAQDLSLQSPCSLSVSTVLSL